MAAGFQVPGKVEPDARNFAGANDLVSELDVAPYQIWATKFDPVSGCPAASLTKASPRLLRLIGACPMTDAAQLRQNINVINLMVI